MDYEQTPIEGRRTFRKTLEDLELGFDFSFITDADYSNEQMFQKFDTMIEDKFPNERFRQGVSIGAIIGYAMALTEWQKNGG